MGVSGVTKVELFEQVRKDYFLSNISIRTIAKRYKIHRRTVRQAIDNPNPPSRQFPEYQQTILTNELKAIIDQWLLSDQKAPKKQRHTALRIFNRLITEFSFKGKLPTIKRHVGERRRLLGLKQPGFIPLAYEPGMEAEVDWYEAYVHFPWGDHQKVYIFQMRACFSGREFHMAFPRCTQQAFLEGHVQAFNYFGGVFKKIRYDNLTSAVTKVLQGRERIESSRFTLLRSHYLFEAIFCQVGKKGAHEKGGVECAVGRFRRQHLVPVSLFENCQALNTYLLEACQQDDERIIQGKVTSIIQDWNLEQTKLLALPKLAFDSAQTLTCLVNSRSLITIKTQRYSVPVYLINQKITIKLSSFKLHAYFQGKCVASHELAPTAHAIKTQLDHYLELLWKKPGALPNALPFKQAKEQSNWPSCFNEFWKQLIDRFSHFDGTRQFLDILFLHRQYSREEIKTCVQQALQLQWISIDAIKQLLSPHCPEPKTFFQTCQQLTAFHRPPSLSLHYDQLLTNNNGELNQ
jgi:transposase